MPDLTIVNTDQLEELLSLTLAKIPPGKQLQYMLGVKNSTLYDLTSVIASFWPGIRNNQYVNTIGTPITGAVVIVNDYTGTLQVQAVAETDPDGELSEFTTRGPCYLYDGVSAYTNYTTGNVYCMNDTNDELLIGFDFPVRNMRVEFDTPGVYGALTFKKSITSGWGAMPGTFVDGTSNFSGDGNIYFGDNVEATWIRSTYNNKTAYWLQVKAASVTTQGIMDVLKPLYVYEHAYPCLLGRGTYYSYDGVSSWVQIYPNFEYSNMGLICFHTDPTASGTLTIHSNYSYKNPPPGTYDLTFSFSSVWYASVNGGSNIEIIANGTYVNKNVIPGVGIVFSSGITASDTATIIIADNLKYIWYAEDSGGTPGTWQNYDFTIGAVDSDETVPFWIRSEPWSSVDVSLNSRYLIMYLYANS